MCRGARLQQHRVCKCHLVNQNDYNCNKKSTTATTGFFDAASSSTNSNNNNNAHVQLAPLTAALITAVAAAATTTSSSTDIDCDLQQSIQAPAPAAAAAAATVVGSPSSNTTNSTTNSTTSTSSIPPPPPSTNHRQRSFMKRSMASRTVSFIEAEVEPLTSQCQFVQNNRNNNTSTIMELDRSQIVVGELLGEGGFSSVYEVRNIFHNRSDDDHDHDFNAMGEDEQQEPKCDYVIKHLRRDVVMPQSSPSHCHSNNRSRSKFYSAAADIVWEARCLAALDHPNIIKLRGVAKGDVQCFGDGTHDSYFLMLDRLDETLTHQLHRWRRQNTAATTTTTTTSGKVEHHHQTPGQNQKQQLPSSSPGLRPPNDIDLMEEKLDLARQVASALQYMHARNIIYRDIKPSNIGLKRTKQSVSCDDGFDPDHTTTTTTTTDAVLLDFGLCRELPFNGTTEQAKKDEFFLMSMVGTRRFIAPEVALGEGYNLQADVYSFTLMVYELMTLVTPFATYSREMHECLVVHENVRPRLSSSWSENVRSFFEQGWARNPVDRPTISEVIDQLDTLAREERSRRSKIEAVRVENDDVVVAEPQRKKAAFKRKNSATKRVWFQPGIFNINGLPSLLRKASSSFYESGGSCCTTTSTASLSRGTSDVSIADGSVEAE
eukprot:CAMPEP_0113451698 /NCGR_PEP_ID=MMETSP0014_2-20120614/6471_1 /TAXON_ID=2857 /ORGANISM="Nitzschia sp." /LENGTH=659 /DNA_ID=CAMNT_0000343059 /DNA_START=541 /DNA_END=2520 /DNA_ORIENTATION=- /assembly_acc=CAM_ASM_000159